MSHLRLELANNSQKKTYRQYFTWTFLYMDKINPEGQEGRERLLDITYLTPSLWPSDHGYQQPRVRVRKRKDQGLGKVILLPNPGMPLQMPNGYGYPIWPSNLHMLCYVMTMNFKISMIMEPGRNYMPETKPGDKSCDTLESDSTAHLDADTP